jgi:diguanylate cyclase
MPMQAVEAAKSDGLGLSSQAVIASMRRHGIRFTAANYAVWQCYLSGCNAVLKRAIDIVISNESCIDQPALNRLYTRHFCPSQGALGLQQAAQISLDQLAETRDLLRGAPRPEEILAKIEEVAEQIRDVMACTQTLLARLSQSQERITLLESYLNDATHDASTDSLTGLFNRRAFDTALRGAAGEAMNSGADLAFVLVDVDHFKLVNDTWGHPVGDDVLRHVAAILTRTVRGGDIVARYGGEEFGIILANTGRRGALSVAENLREAVSAHPFAVSTESGGQTTEAILRVTISAGIACFAPGEPLRHWLDRADQALYRAKNGGRNRVVFGSTASLPSTQLTRPNPSFGQFSGAASKGIAMKPGSMPPDPPAGACPAE